MFRPGEHDERDTFVGYLGDQLAAIRNAAFGLTEEQARMTPCRSALSIGGLVRHATYVMEGRQRRKADPGAGPTPEGYALFTGSFALPEDETLESALAAFDAAAEAYLADIRAADPEGPDLEPPAPWDGLPDPIPTKQRFHLMHHVEEFARHAGHADIIREQIDGAGAASLAAAVEGRPANPFVTPWTPAS